MRETLQLVEGYKESETIEGNLFEGMKLFDISCLKGHAVVIPLNEIKDFALKQDHILNLLDQYYSHNFQDCLGSAEKRLEALFQIKDKWTKSELETYLSDFIDLSVKLDAYLMKNTRIVKDKHPFIQGIEIAYYIKKF